MARIDQADAIGIAPERVEQSVKLNPRQAEDRIDPMPQQSINQCFPARHPRHLHAPLFLGGMLARGTPGGKSWVPRQPLALQRIQIGVPLMGPLTPKLMQVFP